MLKHSHFGDHKPHRNKALLLRNTFSACPGSLLLTFSFHCQFNILQESVNPTTGNEVWNMCLGWWHHLLVRAINCVSLCTQILASTVLHFIAVCFELENHHWRKGEHPFCLAESHSGILKECVAPEVQWIGGFTPGTATGLGQMLMTGLFWIPVE